MSVAERQLIVDPTEGLELITGTEIALEATRHIFLAADLLNPDRRREIGMANGGEELDNKCLRRTNGQLPRCSITPMEFWGEPMPLELFPEGQRPYKLKGAEVAGIPAPSGLVSGAVGSGGGAPKFISDIYYMPIFPGDLIGGVLAGQRRGIVELVGLRGVAYGGVDREMQALFFPPDWKVPVELRLIRQQVEKIAASVADPDVQNVAADMLLSIQESSEYMAAMIGADTTRVLQRVHPSGMVYTYSRIVRHFATQLEVGLNEVTDLVNNQMARNQGVDTAALAALNQETLGAIGAMLTEALTKALGAARPVEVGGEPPAAVDPPITPTKKGSTK